MVFCDCGNITSNNSTTINRSFVLSFYKGDKSIEARDKILWDSTSMWYCLTKERKTKSKQLFQNLATGIDAHWEQGHSQYQLHGTSEL